MGENIQQGQSVTLLSAGGLIKRVVVDILDGIVLVCREEEFVAAARECRDPISIGFPFEDIVPEVG